jgi:trehalose 6-phosphate synthase
VLVQDYHFALLPRFINERLPKATIITFWHIPWPNPESFGICPWRKEVLEGLLGSTILGFHTQYHCPQLHRHRRPLSRGAHRLRELDGFARRTSDEHRAVSHFDPMAVAIRRPAAEHCRMPSSRRGSRKYSGRCPDWHRRRPDGLHEGIIERFHAVERMLELHPERVGRFVFVQIAAPTRSALDEYRGFEEDVHALAARINTRFAKAATPPIRLKASTTSPRSSTSTSVQPTFVSSPACTTA